MKSQKNIFSEVYRYLEQGSQFVDKRHLTVISWIVTALLSSQSLNQGRWEPYVATVLKVKSLSWKKRKSDSQSNQDSQEKRLLKNNPVRQRG